MKCEQCHKATATQVISVTRNGKTEELGVCNECAKALGLAGGIPPLAELLLSFMKDVLPPPLELKKAIEETVKEVVKDAASATTDPKRRCPSCGMSNETLAKHRLFGCAECYAAFPQEVERFMLELQYGNQHCGRVPAFAHHRAKVAGIRREMAKAATANDFRKAAELRDTIRAMERIPAQKDSPHA